MIHDGAMAKRGAQEIFSQVRSGLDRENSRAGTRAFLTAINARTRSERRLGKGKSAVAPPRMCVRSQNKAED
ncbi:hypothetical protein HA38_05130 [Pantoea allii]|nr:hypothetical protein HA38_05130 [Pantoea allii]PBK01619.1 hypothetical protein CMR03_03985 [Pantoea allii]